MKLKYPKVATLAATLITFVSLAGGANGAIVLTEINYNPPEAGTDRDEYVEIYNAGSSSIDLTGYMFTFGFNFTFGSVSIAPSEAILVAASVSDLRATDITNKTATIPSQQLFYNIPASTQVFQWTSGGLSDGGENIALADSLGTEIFKVRYDDNAAWAAILADGGGYTLEVIDPQSQSGNFATSLDATNWRQSTAKAGSAGTAQLVPEPSSALLVGIVALSFVARRRRTH